MMNKIVFTIITMLISIASILTISTASATFPGDFEIYDILHDFVDVNGDFVA